MRRLAFTLLALYLLFSIVAGVFLCDGTLHPLRRPLTPSDEAQASLLARQSNASLRDISIVTPDRLTLRAWLLTPAQPNQQVVILLHGLSDNRTGMIGYAELLLAHHFTVLMPDTRAHGASDGAIATYGLIERNDIHLWFDWLLANAHPTCIDALGESMGAAQLLQSLAVEPRFCAVAAESSFSNFHEIGYDRAGQFFHTGPWLGRTLLRPALAIAFLYGKEKYGLDLSQVSPEDAVTHSVVPVFLIHGRDDSNIPVRHSERIAARANQALQTSNLARDSDARNPNVILWEVPGADHCGAISTAPDEFASRLIIWFTTHQAR
jgi:pimeloyl-ACP methyl ester carboxylesterase